MFSGELDSDNYGTLLPSKRGGGVKWLSIFGKTCFFIGNIYQKYFLLIATLLSVYFYSAKFIMFVCIFIYADSVIGPWLLSSACKSINTNCNVYS
jgi:hypothetical protein